jgi:hypothetical protein
MLGHSLKFVFKQDSVPICWSFSGEADHETTGNRDYDSGCHGLGPKQYDLGDHTEMNRQEIMQSNVASSIDTRSETAVCR